MDIASLRMKEFDDYSEKPYPASGIFVYKNFTKVPTAVVLRDISTKELIKATTCNYYETLTDGEQFHARNYANTLAWKLTDENDIKKYKIKTTTSPFLRKTRINADQIINNKPPLAKNLKSAGLEEVRIPVSMLMDIGWKVSEGIGIPPRQIL